MDALGMLGKVAAKPSDSRIRLIRIAFALILLAVIIFSWNATDVNLSFFDYKFSDLPDYLMGILGIFPLVGLVRGIIDPGLFRKAIWRKVIMGLGALMIIFSVFFLSEKEIIPNTVSPTGTITAETLASQKTQATDVLATTCADDWYFFFGLITLIV